MPDQADKLRELKVTASAVPKPAAAPGIPMIAVTGSRGGVGATTVAVNLAAVLADRGRRVVLVDAAECNSAVAQLAGVQSSIRRGTAEVAAGVCGAVEALVPGPVGMRVLAQRLSDRTASEFSRSAQQRLLSELDTLFDTADLIVVDTGNALTPAAQRIWLRARLAILVTTAADAAVVDCYAAIKQCRRLAIDTNVRILANQCDSDRRTNSMHARFAAACQQFLSHSVRALPSLPACTVDPHCESLAEPRVWEAPDTPFGHAALWLGQAVDDIVAGDLENAARAPQPAKPLTRLHTRKSSLCSI